MKIPTAALLTLAIHCVSSNRAVENGIFLGCSKDSCFSSFTSASLTDAFRLNVVPLDDNGNEIGSHLYVHPLVGEENGGVRVRVFGLSSETAISKMEWSPSGELLFDSLAACGKNSNDTQCRFAVTFALLDKYSAFELVLGGTLSKSCISGYLVFVNWFQGIFDITATSNASDAKTGCKRAYTSPSLNSIHGCADDLLQFTSNKCPAFLPVSEPILIFSSTRSVYTNDKRVREWEKQNLVPHWRLIFIFGVLGVILLACIVIMIVERKKVKKYFMQLCDACCNRQEADEAGTGPAAEPLVQGGTGTEMQPVNPKA